MGTGTLNIFPGYWYLLEIYVKIADSGGRLVVKVDGITDIDFTGDTKPGSDTTFDRFWCGVGGSVAMQWDDMAMNDTSGGADNSWCGDGHVVALVPNGNGSSSQFVGSDGNSTDNYLLVDEIPANGDTDYVASNTAGDKDLYALTNLSDSNIDIKRVWVEARARDTTASAATIQLGVKSGATESWSSSLTLLGSYTVRLVSAEMQVDPDTSAAWTYTGVNALEAGVKVA